MQKPIKPLCRTTPLLVGLLLTGQAGAAGLAPMVQAALAHDATYAVARHEYLAGVEALPQGIAQLLPSVTLNASTIENKVDYTYRLAPGRTRTIDYPFNTPSYSVSLTQPIFRVQLFAQLAQASAKVKVATFSFEQARQDLLVRVIQAYLEALLATDNLRLIGEQKTAIAEQLKQYQRMFESGFGTVTDVNEAQARFDNATAQEIASRSTLEIKQRALQQITGQYPDKLFPLSNRFVPKLPEPAGIDEWIETALAANPYVLASQHAVDVARGDYRIAASGHLPTVDFVASRTVTKNPAYTAVNSTTDTTAIGFQMSWPIFQGGYVNSRMRQFAELENKAKSALNGARNNITQETRQQYLNVVNGVAQLAALEQALKSNELALYSTQKGYQAGMRTSVDVLNAQQQMFTAKRDLYQARYNYITALIKLKAAVGSLNDQDVVLVDGWLDNSATAAAKR